MYEFVNCFHPDKIADAIAGSIVDEAYKKEENPKIAVEVLVGHGLCTIIAETSVHFKKAEIKAISDFYVPNCKLKYVEVPQDTHLATNQSKQIRCGDNGIFKGTPITKEQRKLAEIGLEITRHFPYDGKYVIDEANKTLIVCQSNAKEKQLQDLLSKEKDYTKIINPLGCWTGGIDVDSGATNRKLGSDMGDGITGGGLHGKDLSKADVSINIYCFLKAQELNKPVLAKCAIGDEFVMVNGESIAYSTIVETARQWIKKIGGFRALANWGLIGVTENRRQLDNFLNLR